MLSTISRVTSRRIWFVPKLSVWGTPEWGEINLLMVEEIESVKSILFHGVNVGDNSQSVLYRDLIDHRGNRLPETINNARVLVRSKSDDNVFVVGEESDSGFKIARSPEATGPVSVDLIIIELGD